MKGKSRAFPKGATIKPEVTIRELPPKTRQNGKDLEILCPFCKIPHTIGVNQDSACGTSLHVSAVQTVYPARTVHKHKMVCIKCGESGGEMVRYNNSTIHLIDCRPEVQLAAALPEFSRFSKFVFSLPPNIKAIIQKFTGIAKEVKEVDGHGVETGKILGYFFYKAT